jgi:lysyl endopeptidase
MKFPSAPWTTIGLGAIAALFPSFGQDAGTPPRSADGFVHRAGPARSGYLSESTRALRALGMPRRRVALRPLSASESKPVSRKAGLTVAGVTRELPADVMASGEWGTTAEGRRVWRVAIASAGAESLRVQFGEFHVGTGTVVLLGSDDTVVAGPYTDNGPLGSGSFWTDVVAGDSVMIAYEAPDDATGSDIPFRPTAVSHLFATAAAVPTADGGGTSTRLAAAASCALDVACYPQYNQPASAVAMMMFESDGQAYRCTGSLVSSRAQPAQPLFLTANHCISTEAEANSLIAVFNYQTTACNGTRPSVASSPRVSGAALLQSQPMALGDFTLLRLTRFPDVDVNVLGWYSNEIAANERVIGISHPLGDYKRIAIGQRTRDTTIRFSDGDQIPAEKGIQVAWFQGLTESGSSGSPLLAEVNGAEYLVGTLSAGPDINEKNDRQVCSARNLVASYGRFAAAFPYLEPFLSSTAMASGTDAADSSFSAAPGRNGTAILTWAVTGRVAVQVRVNSPTGPAMTGIEAASGSATTGNWVTNGMFFYLQDASSGDSAGAAKTLAVVRVTGLPVVAAATSTASTSPIERD